MKPMTGREWLASRGLPIVEGDPFNDTTVTLCWYQGVCDRPKDCAIAGVCKACWNPAEVKAMRPGPLWFWHEWIGGIGP